MTDVATLASTEPPLLEVDHLAVEFRLGRGRPPLRAVDDVSFAMHPRETVGLVGESGSGKTTIGRAILGLTAISQGRIRFGGADITRARHRERRRVSRELQVVFQDPYSSLNPTRAIGDTLAESLRAHGGHSRAEVAARVVSMLERVGLPATAAERYPAQFSGGQRQRIAVARALMVEPRLVVCDEPVSSLDLSVQAQVLNLLRELQHDFELSYLFIAHDLAVVRHLSHRIIVLYRGRIMEQGDAAIIYEHPVHPYTRALLEAAPLPDPELQRLRREARVARTPASEQATPADACPFAPRCPHATEVCVSRQPALELASTSSVVACHHWRGLMSKPEVPRSASEWTRENAERRRG